MRRVPEGEQSPAAVPERRDPRAAGAPAARSGHSRSPSSPHLPSRPPPRSAYIVNVAQGTLGVQCKLVKDGPPASNPGTDSRRSYGLRRRARRRRTEDARPRQFTRLRGNGALSPSEKQGGDYRGTSRARPRGNRAGTPRRGLASVDPT